MGAGTPVPNGLATARAAKRYGPELAASAARMGEGVVAAVSRTADEAVDLASRARFEVTPKGTAIPTNRAELLSNLGMLDDKSTSPDTSRKFVGEDSQGPVRIRVEQGHASDPDFTGTPDPLHTVDHMHIDRRANGQTGPWGSDEKVPLDWPFDE
jgi:hypothetical protein